MKFGLFIMGTKSSGYKDIVEQVEYAEELGFESIVLGERHFRHGDLLYPSPYSMAAAFAARTSRIRIGMAARVLSLDHPIHIAEDAATLDILSGGRLDFGVTRASLDEECHVVFQSSLNESTIRFKEALEVIVKAWTEEKFSYEGSVYKIPQVSVYPKPIQKPYPPISIVAVSPETLIFAAEKGYSVVVGAIRSICELERVYEAYRRVLHENGHNGMNAGFTVNRFIYVSDTFEKAKSEIEGPFLEFIKNRAPDLRSALIFRYGNEGNFSFDRFINDFCIIGSPETVTSRIKELTERINLSHLLCSLNYITLDHSLCVKSMELFAREVIPNLTTSH